MRNELTVAQFLGAAALPLGLGILVGIACWWSAGISLGLFFGGVALVTVMLPGWVLSREGMWERLAVAGGLIDGVGIVLLMTIFRGIPFTQWLECYLVLLTYGLALWGIATLLRRAGCHVIVAAGIAVVMGLFWLSFPVWLSPWMNEPVAGWLVPAHPLLAINGVLHDRLGIWTEMGLLYRYTTLSQDVAYELPRTIWPAVIVYLLLALGVLLGKDDAHAGR